jgi:hypothetical protein
MVSEMAMGKALEEPKSISKQTVAESLDGLLKENMLKPCFIKIWQ